MSSSAREQGYRDGRRYAEATSKDNIFEAIVRGLSDDLVSPKRSSSEDYERGWREGVEDRKRK